MCSIIEYYDIKIADDYIDKYRALEESGYNLEFEINTIIDNKDKYIETYNALIDDDFALKKEFNYIVSLYKMLSDNYA